MYIEKIINPHVIKKVIFEVRGEDVMVGFFLHFVTAIDYALIVGRMAVKNPEVKARVIMNVGMAIGCYVGVTLILFLWGFMRDIIWLLIPILVFSGSVMIKLAYEGMEYFEKASYIHWIIKKGTKWLVTGLYYVTRVFSFWIPELGRPSTGKMSAWRLAKWSLVLPFIIGLDDLVGYMGAMTIYNVFGLLAGIYLADIVIDILIFISPTLTRKIVENAVLSLGATYAFLYLAYKSYGELVRVIEEHWRVGGNQLIEFGVVFVVLVVGGDLLMAKIQRRKSFLGMTVRGEIGVFKG